MPRVSYFEIFAQDPNRAMQFYGSVFGWQFSQYGQEPYWLVRTGGDEEPGINGGMVIRGGAFPQPGQPVNAFVCTISVANLDHTVQSVQQGGGVITIPKQAVPGIGWRAYGRDPEGNVIALLQVDPNAQ